MSQCTLDHSNLPSFAHLSDDQSGDGRHKCCGCAYIQGRQAGINGNMSFSLNMNLLPDSQSGTGRHKSVTEAFAMGLHDALNGNNR